MTEIVLKTLKTEIFKKCDSCYDGLMEDTGSIEEIFGAIQHVHKCDHCGARGAYGKSYPIKHVEEYHD